jgi:hypothetical protein
MRGSKIRFICTYIYINIIEQIQNLEIYFINCQINLISFENAYETYIDFRK